MIVPSQDRRVERLRLFVDGGSRGNPGPAAAGVVIADADGTTLVERGFFVGHATNNVAEYHALIRGLELAARFSPQRLEIFADSELVVRQITGQYRVKSPDLQPLFERAQLALLKFDSWQIRHIPRAQNLRADRLANLAMNRKGDVEDAGDDVPSVADEVDGPEHSGGPAVRVRVVLGCDPRICAATLMVGEEFRFTSVTPPGLCVYAAAAVLPAALGLLNEASVMDAPAPTDADRPVRVSCPRPGCHAGFELFLELDG